MTIVKSLVLAINNYDSDKFEEILKGGFDVNQILPGSVGGYTLLHWACINDNAAAVDILIKKYQADINFLTKYGAQPIHLAIIKSKSYESTRLLLEAGADPNAIFTREILLNFYKDYHWLDEFGDKISLVSYAVAQNLTNFAELLTDYGADITVRTKDNRTLLMVALKEQYYCVASVIVDKIVKKCPELINARDNQGKNVLDHLFHDELYKKYRFNGEQFISINILDEIVSTIFLCYEENDYDERIINDFYTQLCNSAAHRSLSQLVLGFLFNNLSRTGSKALSNALLPIQDPDNLFSFDDSYAPDWRNDVKLMIEEGRVKTVDYILWDLRIRREFGLFVPKEEILKMDELISSSSEYRQKIQDFERKFINGLLKETVFRYGKKRETLYNLAAKIFNERTVKPFAKSRKLYKCLIKYQPRNETLEFIVDQMITRLKSVRKRIQLLEKSEKLSKLNCIIPLPYEIILCVYEFMSNRELKHFIDCVENI